MKKKNKIILWIIFFLTVLTTVATMLYDYTNFKRLSYKVEGIVTHVTKTVDGRGNRHYYSEYEFKINNKKYYGKYSSSIQHNIGDALTIKYDKDKPEYNFEQSEDNSKASSIMAFFAVFILLGELAYIEEHTVNKKRKKVKREFNATKKFFKLISSIMLVLLVITIIFIIYSKNHAVMFSMKLLIYLSFGMMLTFFTAYYFVYKSISKVEKNPELLKELEKCEEIKCGVSNVYFSKDRLIEVGLTSLIIKYSDIALMHIGSNTTAEYILLITKDLKKYKIANMPFRYQSNYEQMHEKIMEEIRKRVPNILEGNTKENREIIKEMKKTR